VNRHLRDNKNLLNSLLSLLSVEPSNEADSYCDAKSFSLSVNRSNNTFNTYETKVLVCGLSRIFFSNKKEIQLSTQPQMTEVTRRILDFLFWQKFYEDVEAFKLDENKENEQE
jgi:hypothetical protein